MASGVGVLNILRLFNYAYKCQYLLNRNNIYKISRNYKYDAYNTLIVYFVKIWYIHNLFYCFEWQSHTFFMRLGHKAWSKLLTNTHEAID
jgi:hypothetical protein